VFIREDGFSYDFGYLGQEFLAIASKLHTRLNGLRVASKQVKD
jgi:hypothetical protein